jgi:hypothetical protein
MKPDLLDQSFLHRAARNARPPSVAAASPPGPSVVATATTENALASCTSGSLLDRLLAEAPGEWLRLADCVEEAAARGRRAIAVTGGRRGEGRTTVVQGLARLLRDRGRNVVCCDRGAGLAATAPDDADGIALVDAGVWFPPGPLRRQVVERASLGCDAVIVVRRAGQAPCAARGVVVEAIGLEFLGEVVTFVTAAA